MKLFLPKILTFWYFLAVFLLLNSTFLIKIIGISLRGLQSTLRV